MKNWFKSILSDGGLSSKRLCGFALVVTAILLSIGVYVAMVAGWHVDDSLMNILIGTLLASGLGCFGLSTKTMNTTKTTKK